MSDIQQKPPATLPPTSTEAEADAHPPAISSGRAVFDSRGNAVWELRTDTGHFSREISTTLVQKLDIAELSIEQTEIAKPPESLQQESPALPCGGFNPYERATPKAPDTAANQPVGDRRPSRPVVGRQRKPQGVLERLRNWTASKKP